MAVRRLRSVAAVRLLPPFPSLPLSRACHRLMALVGAALSELSEAVRAYQLDVDKAAFVAQAAQLR